MCAHVLAVAVAMASPLVEGPMVDVVARLAGKEATACGIVRLKQDSVKPLVCASRHLLSKNAFWVAVQIQGEDSFLWRAATQSVDGKTWVVRFDSDITGGSPRGPKPLLEVIPCTGLKISPDVRPGVSCLIDWR